VQRYRARISGPLLDRIDMHLEVASVPRDALRADRPDPQAEPSVTVRGRVERVRAVQMQRAGVINAALTPGQLRQHCALPESAQALIEQAMERLGLSARAYHRILKVARTIADLAGSATISAAHLTEAISYRRLDRAAAVPAR
jgi:magnesium chelatase family protein